MTGSRFTPPKSKATRALERWTRRGGLATGSSKRQLAKIAGSPTPNFSKSLPFWKCCEREHVYGY